MNIQQIEAYLYVARTGNFSRAGELLFLTQPSVSSRIQQLENELGSLLFERAGKSIRLTEAGQAFLPYAETIMNQLSEGKLAIQRLNDQVEGSLQIGTVIYAANHLMPDYLHAFCSRYPKVRLQISTGHSHQVLDMILRHEAHIGIVRSIRHPDIHAIRLLDDAMTVTVYPGHEFEGRERLTLDELSGENLIMFNRGTEDWKLVVEAFSVQGLQPKAFMEIDSIEAMIELVKNRTGIAILPRLSVKREVEEGKLVMAHVAEIAEIHRSYDLITLKDKPIQGIVKVFLESIMHNKMSVVEERKIQQE
ncbi:MAG: LysR family transcriptional regulator [Paenibacillus sp.]|nr:LysR family transcriptional regulator [Paenibacillus sp.]